MSKDLKAKKKKLPVILMVIQTATPSGPAASSPPPPDSLSLAYKVDLDDPLENLKGEDHLGVDRRIILEMNLNRV
jgi:hypothetical protein